MLPKHHIGFLYYHFRKLGQADGKIFETGLVETVGPLCLPMPMASIFIKPDSYLPLKAVWALHSIDWDDTTRFVGVPVDIDGHTFCSVTILTVSIVALIGQPQFSSVMP